MDFKYFAIAVLAIMAICGARYFVSIFKVLFLRKGKEN